MMLLNNGGWDRLFSNHEKTCRAHLDAGPTMSGANSGATINAAICMQW